MQPSDPTRPETSLELTFPDHDANPTGTELVLPASEPPPVPGPVEPAPDDPAPDAAAGPLGDLVAAHFRRVEVAMLGRVLITTLSGTLPASMVRVERRRSLAGRLTRQAGEPIGITVTVGEKLLTFRSPAVGAVEATVGHIVRGVVLWTTPVTVPQWLDELGKVLDALTGDDDATRNALERALLR